MSGALRPTRVATFRRTRALKNRIDGIRKRTSGTTAPHSARGASALPDSRKTRPSAETLENSRRHASRHRGDASAAEPRGSAEISGRIRRSGISSLRTTPATFDSTTPDAEGPRRALLTAIRRTEEANEGWLVF